MAGEARGALKWADGKVIKNEVDMQVCFEKRILQLVSVIVYVYMHTDFLLLFSIDIGCINSIFHSDILY